MRIRELDDWPPPPAGSYSRSYVAPYPEQAIIEKAFPLRDKWVTFTCSFDGKSHSYDYQAKDEKTAVELKRMLELNIGKTLFSVGNAELQNC